MAAQFYAIRLDPDQIVAAEIGDRAAAELLDAGQSIVLATEAELHRLARTLGKQRTAIFRAARPAKERRIVATVPESRPAVTPPAEPALSWVV